MTMIRREALTGLGGWAEWCICEDAELGLRLMANGYSSVYVNEVFGRGLTAQSFAGYKGQRYRWAYGGVQPQDIASANGLSLSSALKTGQQLSIP